MLLPGKEGKGGTLMAPLLDLTVIDLLNRANSGAENERYITHQQGMINVSNTILVDSGVLNPIHLRELFAS